MKKLLLLLVLILASCSPDSEKDITIPSTPDEIAAEAAKKTSDSLYSFYGANMETTGLKEFTFLFKSNGNTYLSGKSNQNLWVGVFNENSSNIGEATFTRGQSNEYVVRSNQHKLLDGEYFFSLYLVDKVYKEEISGFPYTQLILKHNISEHSLKGINQSYEANYGNEVINIMKGYEDSYLVKTSGQLTIMGTNDIIYINPTFGQYEVWKQSTNCYPDQDYSNLTFINEVEYLFYDESSISYVKMNGCASWNITVDDIYEIGTCLNCDYSLELLEYSETVIKVKAGLQGNYREAIINTMTGEITTVSEL